MAGNLVKWWKHKILGGYKQFSVQECTTDSEELMYHQVRASSSCSAPPDLLLVSDRENNIPLHSPVVNIIATTTTNTTAATSANISAHKQHSQQQHDQHQHHQHHHHSQHQQQQHGTKDSITGKHMKISSTKNSSGGSGGGAKSMMNTQSHNSAQNHHHSQQQQQQQQHQDEIDGQAQQQNQYYQRHQYQQQSHQQQQQQHDKSERIRLEEFTCDVSVEGGKSSQPLQFSFTFYDLDGHHGKITKDDIVGIVYTIYESIGKSVVVPHCGSKTINVRLTVSPEGKGKTAAGNGAGGGGGISKFKKITPTGGVGVLEHSVNASTGTKTCAADASATHGHNSHGGHSRRQHRYRPRKLIKSDDEDDDSNSEKEKEATTTVSAATVSALLGSGGSKSQPSKSNSSKYGKMKMGETTSSAQQCCQQRQDNNVVGGEHNMDLPTPANHQDTTTNFYENVAANFKCCSNSSTKEAIMLKKGDMHATSVIEQCRNCCVTSNADATVATAAANTSGRHIRATTTTTTTDVYLKQASSRVKMLRKARKQKYQDHCLETRQRSLSVGNESCWKNRHYQQQQQQTAKSSIQQQQQHHQEQQQVVGDGGVDMIDGVQLRHSHKNDTVALAHKRNSAECWKTALNRNDLISIIRESMEKNRLCFQLNGKPQASVSPIRQQQQQRQRSNTVSKIPTLIANHSNSITTTMSNHQQQLSHININSKNQHHHHHLSHNNNNNVDLSIHDSLYHPQPHIPIYHQQMAINPAVLAAQNSGIGHNKMNLCGYDSFLHATICGGGTSHSPPPSTPVTAPISNQPTNSNHHQQQPIATVQPIMTTTTANVSGVTATANPVPKLQSSTPKIYLNSTTTNQVKTSKILRSGSYSQRQQSQQPHVASQNSPQYHGYQRLSSSAISGNYQQQQLTQNKYNLAALNLHNSSVERSQVEQLEKWLHSREKCHKAASRKDAAKNFDHLLYARLSEKLQESSLNNEKENVQRRKYKMHKQQQRHQPNVEATKNTNSPAVAVAADTTDLTVPTAKPNYLSLIPINGDPTECENLLGHTTDEETSNESVTPTIFTDGKITSSVDAAKDTQPTATSDVHVATGTLINLNDDDDADDDETEANDVAKLEAHDNDVDGIGDDDAINDEDVNAQVHVGDDDDEVELEEDEANAGESAESSADSINADDSNNDAVIIATNCNSTADGSSNSGSGGGAAAGANISSSLVHRYVHEHIHHHYHHFEEKDE